MFVTNTDPREIVNIVHMLKFNSSKGNDDITPSIIKDIICEIALPLTHIFNIFLQHDQFQDKLKLQELYPFINVTIKIINNYRPISIRPYFSKILERLMYSRLLNYLTVNKILCDKQYGFREGHSTDMTLLHMINDFTEGLHNKFFCIGIFIDLSKAFDTVDHKLLIRKLNHYGIRGTALQWFIDYLTNLTKYFSINKINSTLAPNTCGIPHASILGPLLFLIFINDIVNTLDS